jgi:DNA polymerase-1
MKLALVFDAPKSSGIYAGVAGTYLSRTLAACATAAGVDAPEIAEFYAVSEIQPGGKAPPIDKVRKEIGRLVGELQEWMPDRVLSFGAGALNALTTLNTVDGKAPVAAISKQRGRMRWLDIGDETGGVQVAWLPTINHTAVMRSPDLHRDLTADIYKILSQAEPLPKMPIELFLPETPAEIYEAMGLFEANAVVSVDVETTGLSPYRDSLLAVGIGAMAGGNGIAVVLTREVLENPANLAALDAELWRKDRRVVGHNLKFDHQFLARATGFWAPDNAPIGDTLLLSYLLDERPNRPTSRVRGLGLKDAVATRYDRQYGFEFASFYDQPEEGRDWAALYDYLAEDVCYTARLWRDLETEADATTMKAHDELLMPISRAIARCEYVGAAVDVDWVAETIDAFERRIARRRAVLDGVLLTLTDREVTNVLSPIQVADVMYDDWKMTPDVRKHGKITEDDRSTDKDHVKAAVSKYLGTSLDGPARWLRSLELLRRDVKTRTTFQKSLLDRVDDDGRVRANFLVHGTSTGRLSSQGPNLQNVPAVDREDSGRWRPMRRAFRPPEGWSVIEVDYSQLELRVAAALSGDPALTEVFRSGRDVHREMASAIFSKPPADISKAERFLAKAVSFGILYGRGARALATGAEMRYVEQQLGGTAWTEEMAEAFIRKFLRLYPDLAAWAAEVQETTLRDGYVESPYGRRRRFPLMPKSDGEVGAIRRQAVNTPIQGTASDICLLAMVRLQDRLENMTARVWFPVHDSLVIEAETEQVTAIEAICREEMEIDFMGVPLTVDFEYGPTWADVAP